MKYRPSPNVKCSRCGSQRDLALITQKYSSDSQSGRILLYCPPCINDYKHNIHLTIPLSEINDESFLAIYEKDLSGSHPGTAVEIVFGEALPQLVRQAEEILERKEEASCRDKKMSEDRIKLIRAYSEALHALREAGIVRTKNVVGELGESYAAVRLGIELVETNVKDIDAVDSAGRGYNIKAVTESSAVRTSSIRLPEDCTIETPKFDFLIVVILTDFMELKSIYQFTWKQFWNLKRWSKTQKSWFLSLTKTVLTQGDLP